MKIKEIKLNNYRSFIGDNTISFDKIGKNLFIQGENGSGKSTICGAINNVLDASDGRRTKSIATKIFRKPFESTAITNNSNIEILFTDGNNFTFNNSGFTTDEFEFISKARRLKGFLEYKNLLPIYLYSNNEKHNLFRLFVEGPFSKLRNPLTKKIIENEWNGDKKVNLPPDFYKGIFQLATTLQDKINSIIRYFDPEISINFKSKKTWTTGVLYIEAKLNGKKLINYGDYFNEAKLVALSISIYLAVILELKKENSNDACKTLILDDIFIGMDLSNRIPLLKILDELFNEYQIIISSFDENWYNLSKFYLKNEKWKFIKVFSQLTDTELPKSFIHDDTLDDYRDKADFFFKRFDYPTCANYIRKAFEKKLKEFLPYNLSHSLSEDGLVKKNGKLDTNFKNFISLLKSCNLDTTTLDDFYLYTKILLNPLSHDNIESPIFKRELEASFIILDNIYNIKSEILKKLTANDICILKLPIKGADEVWYEYKYELVDNLRRISQGTNIGYPSSRVILKSTKKKGEDKVDIIDSKKITLVNEYKRICTSHGIEQGDYTKVFRTNQNVTIHDMQG